MTDMSMLSGASSAEQALRDQVSIVLLQTILEFTQKASQATDSRMAAEWSKGVQELASSLVILDPAVIAPQGVPPEVLARSAPPRPVESAKRKAITKSRTPSGDTTYTMEG
jgi:hypothetical protein